MSLIIFSWSSTKSQSYVFVAWTYKIPSHDLPRLIDIIIIATRHSLKCMIFPNGFIALTTYHMYICLRCSNVERHFVFLLLIPLVRHHDSCDYNWDFMAILFISWWRHETETFSALLAICAGNSPVSGEFPAQRPVTRWVWCFLWYASE